MLARRKSRVGGKLGEVYFLPVCYVGICGAKGYGFLLHGVLPMMAYTGRLRPKGVPFSGFRYMKGYSLSLSGVYKREAKSVISVGKNSQKG